MGKDEKKEKVEEYFPHKWRKDFRVGSPQRVFRAVQDSIEDLGYHVPSDGVSGVDEQTGGIQLKGSPISDTATFRGQVRSEKALSASRHKGYFMTGIVLSILGVVLIASGIMGGEIIVGVVGIPLLILGLVFIAISGRVSKAFVLATVEGEAYKATAKMAEYSQELDVVADVRLTIQARIGIFRGGTEIKEEKPEDADMATLGNDFRDLCDKVGGVLPKFTIRQSE